MALSLKEPSKKLTFLGMATKKPISYSFFLESKICFIQFWKENMHGHHTNTYNNIFYIIKKVDFLFFMYGSFFKGAVQKNLHS